MVAGAVDAERDAVAPGADASFALPRAVVQLPVAWLTMPTAVEFDPEATFRFPSAVEPMLSASLPRPIAVDARPARFALPTAVASCSPAMFWKPSAVARSMLGTELPVGVPVAVATVATVPLIERSLRIMEDHLSPASQETLEGFTMVVATLVLFYVSYWLLSKMEVVKWNHFVKSKVHDAVTQGSALALASAAFLAVYREGFETTVLEDLCAGVAPESTEAALDELAAAGIALR